MEIVSRDRIDDFQNRHPQSREPLNTWMKTIEAGSWQHIAEIRQAFNSVDYVNGFLVFDIKGNDHRLIAVAIFHNQKMLVKHIFTHAEYDWWWRKLLRKKR